MKKSMWLVLFFLAAGTGIFAQTGTLRELSGTVELKAPGSQAFVAAKKGDTLSQDTVISTGFKSTALVELGSAVITIRPLTRLTLTEIQASQGNETINVNLQAGRVRVDVNPPPGTKTTMSVKSPTATASVRGTGFDFDTRNLRVSHGRVSFKGQKGFSKLVGAGDSSKILEDDKTADPVRVRMDGLLPSAPVGTDSSSGTGAIVESSGGSRGVITIQLDYGQGGQ